MKTSLPIKLCILSIVLSGAQIINGSAVVYADTAAISSPASRPITITALCSDEKTGLAYWRLGNSNPAAVTITANPELDKPTQVSLPYGFTSITTKYDAASSTPKVTFQQPSLDDQSVPVRVQACADPIANCVDGFTRDNLHLDWSSTGMVTFATAHGALLCEDVPVYLSSYTLPKTYSGSGIFDDSSLPQQLFSSTSIILHKGTTGTSTVTIAVPNACTDFQLDAYYAPEVTAVSYAGHNERLIYGDIYLHTKTDCSAPIASGQGGGTVAGETTTTPVAIPAAKKPQLANTGAETALPMFGALSMALSAAAVNFSLITKAKNLLTRF